MKDMICSSIKDNWKELLLSTLLNDHFVTQINNYKSCNDYIIKFYNYNDNGKMINYETTFTVDKDFVDDNNELIIYVKQNNKNNLNNNIWKCSFSELVDELYNIHDFEIYIKE